MSAGVYELDSGMEFPRGRMRRNGRSFGIADPKVVTKAEAAQHVTPGGRPICARLPFEQAVLLTKTG
jgi:hypothetical protein